MSHQNDVAIALRHNDFSETSQVLVVFGRRSGKVRLMAKGVRRGTKKRFATGIDLLEMGHLVYTQRADRQERLANLVEWKQITLFSGLRNDFQRLAGGQYVAEITAKLTEDGDPHPLLFDALEGALRSLEGGSPPLQAVVEFQVRLLHEIGLFPDLSRCQDCGNELRPGRSRYFSSHQGGLVCADCESVIVEKRRVHRGVPELLGSLWNELETIESPESEWIGGFDLLDYHLAHLMGKQAAMAEYVVPQARRRVLQ